MSTHEIGLATGDYLTPEYRHATVADAMRHGVISCPADLSLRAVARMMATHHVHSVVVRARELGPAPHADEGAWGIVSDLDVVRSASMIDDLTAAQVAAASEVSRVQPGTPLADAAAAMALKGIAHLIVVSPSTGEPVGVISTLDIAGNLAWARA